MRYINMHACIFLGMCIPKELLMLVGMFHQGSVVFHSALPKNILPVHALEWRYLGTSTHNALNDSHGAKNTTFYKQNMNTHKTNSTMIRPMAFCPGHGVFILETMEIPSIASLSTWLVKYKRSRFAGIGFSGTANCTKNLHICMQACILQKTLARVDGEACS